MMTEEEIRQMLEGWKLEKKEWVEELRKEKNKPPVWRDESYIEECRVQIAVCRAVIKVLEQILGGGGG